MSENIFFVVELEVGAERVDELRSILDEMAAIAERDEPGTLAYEWFLTKDGAACSIYERYANSAAAVDHSHTFPPELVQRAMAFLPTRLTAYGRLSDEIRSQRIEPLLAAVTGIEFVALEPGGGFSR